MFPRIFLILALLTALLSYSCKPDRMACTSDRDCFAGESCVESTCVIKAAAGDDVGLKDADPDQEDMGADDEVSDGDVEDDAEDDAPDDPLDPPEERELFKMVKIQSGSFLRGASDDDPSAQPDERPRREIGITRDFWVTEAPITQREWETIFPGEQNPSFQKDCPECPVERVNWLEAVLFANMLSEKDNFSRCYSENLCDDYEKVGRGCDEDTECVTEFSCTSIRIHDIECTGYRLPTEAEWEYIARAGQQAPTYGELDAIAQYSANSSGSSPVCQKERNAFGLCDVLGTVWEWVGDYYGAEFYETSVRQVEDPGGPVGTGQGYYERVLRGCSFQSPARDCRLSARNDQDPLVGSHDVGFRLVRVP